MKKTTIVQENEMMVLVLDIEVVEKLTHEMDWYRVTRGGEEEGLVGRDGALKE